MKQIMALLSVVFIAGSAMAQQPAGQKPMTPEQKRLADLRKNAVSGFVRDARNRPVEGVQAYIYAKDSAATILASGYTDATGYYETNSVAAGKYDIKILYPSTNKAILVNDVIMKRGLTDISLKNDIPVADTGINFLFFQPKAATKGKSN